MPRRLRSSRSGMTTRRLVPGASRGGAGAGGARAGARGRVAESVAVAGQPSPDDEIVEDRGDPCLDGRRIVAPDRHQPTEGRSGGGGRGRGRGAARAPGGVYPPPRHEAAPAPRLVEPGPDNVRRRPAAGGDIDRRVVDLEAPE